MAKQLTVYLAVTANTVYLIPAAVLLESLVAFDQRRSFVRDLQAYRRRQLQEAQRHQQVQHPSSMAYFSFSKHTR
jgi:signal-transduction protein with cAMP-binding, CBS, and nucleotidyltransferase domain